MAREVRLFQPPCDPEVSFASEKEATHVTTSSNRELGFGEQHRYNATRSLS